MKRRLLTILALVAVCAPLALADEGMWLYNHFPSKKVQKQYGFLPTQAWLDHLRLGSVRFNSGGTGSFVSAKGLTFTNHHIAQDCLTQISTPEHDYFNNGFYAKTEAEEVKCPDVELNQLMGIEDVTAKVQGAAKPGMTEAEAGQARRAVTAEIESDCAKQSGLRCDVVTLYAGGMYNLYKYKKYTDVRLVFAPEMAIAFFGGDPDNFEYPRWDLDISFFRVYENGKPANLGNDYLKFSHSGVKDGDLVFVSGNPGSTGRLDTMAQLEFEREVDQPFRLEYLKRRDAVLHKWAAESAENKRRAQDDIFGLENSIKARTGMLGGLKDDKLMAKKQKEEKALQEYVNGNAKRKGEYGDPWGAIAKAEQGYREFYAPYMLLDGSGRRVAFPGELNFIARSLVRGAAQRQVPNAQRLPEFRESALGSLEQELFSTAPIYKDLETVEFADALALLEEKLGAENPAVKKVLNGKTPADAAQYYIAGTKLDDVNYRKQLWEGGTQAIEQSNDPLIWMMREIEPEAFALRKRHDDTVQAPERSAGAALAKIRFAQGGTDNYPDATFTLRLSYGAMRGYTDNGEGTVPAGTKLPYFTTLGGTYDHAARHGNEDPYKLPQSWVDAKPKLKLDTPFNAVETADSTGGNSGSPVVDKKGEVIGILFDGNIQTLPWDYVYDDTLGRSVHVDTRGIIEALRTIYHADALADELMGTSAKAGHVTKKHDGKAAEEKKK